MSPRVLALALGVAVLVASTLPCPPASSFETSDATPATLQPLCPCGCDTLADPSGGPPVPGGFAPGAALSASPEPSWPRSSAAILSPTPPLAIDPVPI